jgi:hypothetical protein
MSGSADRVYAPFGWFIGVPTLDPGDQRPLCLRVYICKSLFRHQVAVVVGSTLRLLLSCQIRPAVVALGLVVDIRNMGLFFRKLLVAYFAAKWYGYGLAVK